MKLKSLLVSIGVSMIPLALFWGCGSGKQPLAPANLSGLTVHLSSSSTAQFVGAAQNTILYSFTGTGAPVTGSYGPLSASEISDPVSFTVSLNPSGTYTLFSAQINSTAAGLPLALGAAPFSADGVSIVLGPLNKTCYVVNNFPFATTPAYNFQNNTFANAPTSMDIECDLNANSSGFELDDPTLTTNRIAYVGNGNFVNFDSVPASANFKTQSSASKVFVETGSTASPQNYPPAVNDVYCVKLTGGGYAWLQITGAGSIVASNGPSFVFRLNTTKSYYAYQQSTSDLSGACGGGSNGTATPTPTQTASPTPYAPLANSQVGAFTGNNYGIAVYPGTSAATSIFVTDAGSIATGTAYIRVLPPSLASVSTSVNANWPQGLAVNSAGTTLYVSSPYYQPPGVSMYSLPNLSTIGAVGSGTAVTLPDTPSQVSAGEFSVPGFLAVSPNSGTYPNGLFVTDSGTSGFADVVVFGAPTTVDCTAVTYWNGQIGSGTTPTGVATDGVTVFVADSNNSKIETYTVNGIAGTAWATDNNPAGPMSFSGPQGIALDTNYSPEILFITDTGNNRVVEMTATGTFTASWGTWGLGTGVTPSTFSAPTGIAVGGANPPDVYVADSGNKRVLKFNGF